MGTENREAQRIMWGIHDDLERRLKFNEERLVNREREVSELRAAVELGAVQLRVARDTIKALAD